MSRQLKDLAFTLCHLRQGSAERACLLLESVKKLLMKIAGEDVYTINRELQMLSVWQCGLGPLTANMAFPDRASNR
jgi:hypothetical protein